jgi:type I restriction enzyme M protein
LEGREVSIILKSDLEFENNTKRIDSEYLKKEYLNNIESITSFAKGCTKLGAFIKHLSGGATPLGAEYETKGIPFLRVQNIMQNYFNLGDVVYLNKVQDEEIKRSRLKERDVLLTITGVSYGKSAVVPKPLINANINQHSVKISLNEGLNPYFLSTFLNCKFGKLQSDKNIVGVTRPALDYEVIRNFKIPNVDMILQKMIEEIICKSDTLSTQSKVFYLEAEQTLLESVGLTDWEPSIKNNNQKKFIESFIKSGRLDAEYYQPKYDELNEHLLKSGRAIKLGSALTLNKRGTQPIYTEDQKGIAVLNSKHIRENRIELNDNRYGILEKANPELIIKKYDVLINGTGVGTIGRCAVYLRKEPALPDNHVTILRTVDLDPIFLSVQLNSIIGKLQVEKYFKGSSGQIELYPTDINEFIIWKAPKEIQLKIRSTIEESENLRVKSEALLRLAKETVEVAIKHGEVEAIAYIKHNNK